MARKREDSFKIALDTLRAELRAGAHRPGARLTANDIAARLSLSQTPVREALSRLTGEGLLQDRRGQGFFVPSLGERDLVALFRLQLALLQIAGSSDRPAFTATDIERVSSPGAPRQDGLGIVLATERLLRLFAAGASAPLSRQLGGLHDQLASVRSAEPRVLQGLEQELASLRTAIARGDAQTIASVLEQFFGRRIQAASALAQLQGDAANIESI